MVFKKNHINSMLNIRTVCLTFLQRRVIGASDESYLRAELGPSEILWRPYLMAKEPETEGSNWSKFGIVSFQAN